MPRVKTSHSVPAFATLPAVDHAHVARATASLHALRERLPRIPARRPDLQHARRFQRLHELQRLLEDPEVARLAGVGADLPQRLLERLPLLLRLAAAALPLAWGAEDGTLLAIAVLVRSNDQLFAAAKEPGTRSLRENLHIQYTWEAARQVLCQSRAEHLRTARRSLRRLNEQVQAAAS